METRLTQGQRFADDYEIVELLAEGGMGEVYLARQISTGSRRALKVMRAELVRDERSRQRFVDEARVGSRIESDHVVEVLGAGVDRRTGLPWLAMELLTGETLDATVERHGPLGPEKTLAVFEHLCHALDQAHAVGVVHRDLKPENLFLAQTKRVDGQPTLKVLDFGIAKFVHEAAGKTTQAIGTPFWMAPEQSDLKGRVSPATDIWALGLIAFYLLTGKSYWLSAQGRTSTPQFLREMLVEELEPASTRARELASVSLPEGFDAWFARCLVRQPSERLGSAFAALEGLRQALGHQRVVAPTAPLHPEPVRRVPKTLLDQRAAGTVTWPGQRSSFGKGAWVAVGALGFTSLVALAAIAVAFGLASRDDTRHAEPGPVAPAPETEATGLPSPDPIEGWMRGTRAGSSAPTVEVSSGDAQSSYHAALREFTRGDLPSYRAAFMNPLACYYGRQGERLNRRSAQGNGVHAQTLRVLGMPNQGEVWLADFGVWYGQYGAVAGVHRKLIVMRHVDDQWRVAVETRLADPRCGLVLPVGSDTSDPPTLLRCERAHDLCVEQERARPGSTGGAQACHRALWVCMGGGPVDVWP